MQKKVHQHLHKGKEGWAMNGHLASDAHILEKHNLNKMQDWLLQYTGLDRIIDVMVVSHLDKMLQIFWRDFHSSLVKVPGMDTRCLTSQPKNPC